MSRGSASAEEGRDEVVVTDDSAAVTSKTDTKRSHLSVNSPDEE